MLRRIRIAVTCLLAIASVGCGSQQPAESTATPASVPTLEAGVLEVAITVSNLKQSAAFFVGALEARPLQSAFLGGDDLSRLTGIEGAEAKVEWLQIGRERIALREFVGTEGRGVPSSAQSNDIDFQHLALVVADMDGAHERVTGAGVHPVSVDGPQTIPKSNPAAAGIRAFYFRDADGHPLELIWYPEGKGLDRWQRRDGMLFLGVDHTAIAVSDTERSLAFYRGLGLRVAGRSLNMGAEQDRLSGVKGARVRITGLRGVKGFGVEFLEYLAPSPGVSSDPPLTPADTGFYVTSIVVGDFDATLERVESLGAGFVSSGVGPCGASCLEGGRAVVVRDPDGHAIRIVEAL